MPTAAPAVRRLQTGQPDVDRVVGQLADDVQRLLASPLVAGLVPRVASTPRVAGGLAVYAPGDDTDLVAFTATNTRVAVPHALGRKPLGRLVVWQSAIAQFWDVDPATVGLDPKRFVVVQTGATAVNARLYVF